MLRFLGRDVENSPFWRIVDPRFTRAAHGPPLLAGDVQPPDFTLAAFLFPATKDWEENITSRYNEGHQHSWMNRQKPKASRVYAGAL